jgi:hypothetical protein
MKQQVSDLFENLYKRSPTKEMGRYNPEDSLLELTPADQKLATPGVVNANRQKEYLVIIIVNDRHDRVGAPQLPPYIVPDRLTDRRLSLFYVE